MTPPGPAAVPPRGYLPGDWYVVLGGRVVLALPGDERERAAAAWALVDAGAGADEVLDQLVSRGLSSLAGFALVSEDDGGTTRVLLRGRAEWCGRGADGPVTASGARASTWHEVLVREVGPWTLDLPAEPAERGAHAGVPDEPGLRVGGGLVRAARLVHDDHDHDHDHDLNHDPEPATEPVSARRADQADHDGMTRGGGWGREELQRHPPGIPGQPQAPSTTATPVARLVVSHGEEVEVDRVVLVGRAPEARRSDSTEHHRLVAVPSPQQEISSTHLEVRPGSGADHGSAVVTDLGSTNGTVLVQPGLPPEPLQPGIAVQLVPGAIIDLGDGVSIQVAGP